ncbi:MAG: hypothetical protein CMM26_11965 [Rhodospirillaceae bacterium]|nr:hypothetical protein [Rhodospirillaceae bacterium]|tara:strand:- start:1146 stop:1346 length:201 start_codon:yes stop_codon:yes gene_type:complete
MGRPLVCGEAGGNIVPKLEPADNGIVIEKPGNGSFYKTGSQEEWDGCAPTVDDGCDNRGLCPDRHP